MSRPRTGATRAERTAATARRRRWARVCGMRPRWWSILWSAKRTRLWSSIDASMEDAN